MGPAAKRKRWLKLAIIAVLALGLMYACRGERTWRWEEEVVLADGERLLLDRSVRMEKISAPFNPFQSAWAWRESTITVRDGPADVKSAQYEARLLPMLIERDSTTKQWIVVGISMYCGDRAAYTIPKGDVYAAFRLSPHQAMQQVPMPEWAWERRSNLLKPNSDKPPPRRVTPEFADRFNREESRGEREFFLIDRLYKVSC